MDEFDDFGNRIKAAPQQATLRASGAEAQVAAAHVAPRPNDDGGDDNDSPDSDEDVEIIIAEQPVDAIDAPLVAPVSGATSTVGGQQGALLLEDRRVPASREHSDFFSLLAGTPSRQRNVAFLGDLHHGKSSIVDLLAGKAVRRRQDEVDRKVSLKSNIVSALVSGHTRFKTTVLATLIDTPGHPELVAETAAALRLADSAVICVDAADGVTPTLDRLIRLAVSAESLPCVLLITKMDRLVLDIKLPPLDAYLKIRALIDTVNNIFVSCGKEYLVSPLQGTVMFSSVKLGWFFSLETFAAKYSDVFKSVSAPQLSRKLWGPTTFDMSSRTFVKISGFTQVPSFVTFVLEPLYKIVSHSLSGKGSTALSEHLSSTPASPLVASQEAVKFFCGDVKHEAWEALLSVLPTSPEMRNSRLCERIGISDPSCVVAVLGLARAQGTQDIFSFTRVLQGTLHAKRSCNIIEGSGERHAVALGSAAEDVNFAREVIADELLIKTVDGFVSCDTAVAGQVICMRPGGVVRSMAIVTQNADSQQLQALFLTPLAVAPPLVRIHLTPVAPKHMKDFHKGLQILEATSPLLDVITEANGEFTVSGFGELHLDTAMHELRTVLCPRMHIQRQQPFVPFRETVRRNRGVLAAVSNEKVRLCMTAGSLDDDLVDELDSHRFLILNAATSKDEQNILRQRYHWDALEARSVFAIGPEKTKGTDVMCDDLLEPRPQFGREALASGFRSVMSTGPLCGEPVRGVRVTLISADSKYASERNVPSALLASLSMNGTRQALLGADLRLMEPVSSIEVITTMPKIGDVTEIISLRRGKVLSETHLDGTPLALLKCLVPTIDSFGLETQIRVKTQGEAFPVATFSHWDMVPGDPFDESIKLGQRQMARGFQLARDFVLKTRVRKGLSSNIVGDL